MMKKFILFITIILALISTCVYADKEPGIFFHKVFLDDTFDDSISVRSSRYVFASATYGILQEEGRGNIVRVKRQNGKKFYVNPAMVDAEYTVPTTEKSKPFQNVSFEMDVKASPEATLALRVVPYANALSTTKVIGSPVVNIATNISVSSYISGGIRNGDSFANDGQWHSYRFDIDSINKEFDVYIDGKLVVDNAWCSDFGHEIKGFHTFGAYTTVESDLWYYIDNIKFSSASVDAEVVKEGVNNGKVSYLYNGKDDKVLFVVATEKDGVVKDIKTEFAKPDDGCTNLYFNYDLLKGEELKAVALKIGNSTFTPTKQLYHSVVTEEECDEVLEKWRVFLVGTEDKDLTNPYVNDGIKNINYRAIKVPAMNDGTNEKVLFGTEEISNSSELSTHLGYIFRLAESYGTYGATNYKKEEIKNKILFAFEWTYNNVYGIKQFEKRGWEQNPDRSTNWYDVFVDGPKDYIRAIIIMKDHLTDEQIEKYLSYYFELSKTNAVGDSVANKYARSYNMMAYSLLTHDILRAKKTAADLRDVIAVQTDDLGYQVDGMFLLHTAVPYTGLYGINLLDGRFMPLYKILSGTVFDAGEEMVDLLVRHYRYTYAPSVYKRKMMSAVMGRSNGGVEETYEGGRTITVAVDVYALAKNEDDKHFLAQYIKRQVSKETCLALTGYSKHKYVEEIYADETIEPYNFCRMFYTGDRVLWQRDDAAMAVSMSSTRIYTYETTNGDNKKGWFTGDGMFYVYSGENYADQYAGVWWQNVDRAHLPGTTTDIRPRSASIASGNIYAKNDFAGGVTYNDEYAVSAMDFKAYNNTTNSNKELFESSLVAKKSWFLFDDEAVALGAGISAPAFESVLSGETISPEARTYITNYLLGTGEDVHKGSNWFAFSKGAAYIFPDGRMPKVSKTEGDYSFFESYFDHGVTPDNDKYSYIVLPNADSVATESYSANMDVEILSNTELVQAVKEKTLGITGVVFWQAGTFKDITVSEPIVMMLSQKGRTMTVKIADPTQKLQSVTVTVKGKELVFDLSDVTGETLTKEFEI